MVAPISTAMAISTRPDGARAFSAVSQIVAASAMTMPAIPYSTPPREDS
jgi:hypothetical protein